MKGIKILIQIQEPINISNIGEIQKSTFFKKAEDVIRITISKKDKDFLVLSQKDNQKQCQACIQQYDTNKTFSERPEAENEFIQMEKALVDSGYTMFKH